jgi:hypothetical protein
MKAEKKDFRFMIFHQALSKFRRHDFSTAMLKS